MLPRLIDDSLYCARLRTILSLYVAILDLTVSFDNRIRSKLRIFCAFFQNLLNGVVPFHPANKAINVSNDQPFNARPLTRARNRFKVFSIPAMELIDNRRVLDRLSFENRFLPRRRELLQNRFLRSFRIESPIVTLNSLAVSSVDSVILTIQTNDKNFDVFGVCYYNFFDCREVA